MDIEKWLAEFEQRWKSKDVDSVLDLFNEDVDYYETPFQKFSNKKELREEWKGVQEQKDVEIETEVFSRDGGKFTVKWELSYTKEGNRRELRGVYLVKLNPNNQCYEFWQYSCLK